MISWYIDSSCICSPSKRPIGATSGRAEEFLRLPQPLDERVDVVAGVVEVQRRTRAGGHAEALVQRLGAVMAGAHRDAVSVEHLADVVRVDLPPVRALQGEGD